jgi:hypothetical protein
MLQYFRTVLISQITTSMFSVRCWMFDVQIHVRIS